MKKKEAPPSKKGPAKAVKKVVNEFAYGLVGSDVESPNFDPLQLSAGRSEETVNWYRAAELKVSLPTLFRTTRTVKEIQCNQRLLMYHPNSETQYYLQNTQHGRVCMLAALGLSVAPAFHFNDPVFDTTLGYGRNESPKLFTISSHSSN